MKWETLYCPNRSCHHYGRPFGEGLLVKNGTSHGKKQALCRSCGRRVSLAYGTAYFDLEADPALFELTVRALAEGNSIQGTARIVQIDKDIVEFCPYQGTKSGRGPAVVRNRYNRRLTRKTTAFSKELPGMEKQLWLSLACYHFCLPHLGLREELPTPEPTRGNGSPCRWWPVTPAMAVGMTDHVWTTA